MKKRTVTVITFALALVLVSSVAYAAKKKDKSRPVEPSQDQAQEEALKAELLEAVGEQTTAAATPTKTIAPPSKEQGKGRAALQSR